MRLFNIIFIFLVISCFASFAAQKLPLAKKNELTIKAKPVIPRQKINILTDFKSNTDRLQQDLISSITTVKLYPSTFILFLIVSFSFFSFQAKNDASQSKTFNRHFRCLFKILYPKHFFW